MTSTRRRYGWLIVAALAGMMVAGPALAAKAEDGAAPDAEDAGVEPKPGESFEEFIQRTKNPVDWLRWGADFRFRHTYINNGITFNKDAPGHEWSFQRYRGRFWTTLTPVKDVDVNARLTWEGRRWFDPETRQDWDQGETLFDKLNVHWRNIGGSNVSIKAGRQDIIFGTGWLVLEGTPLDGSRTIFFDAYRATVDLEEVDTTVDLIYIDNKSDSADAWIKHLEDLESPTVEQDERGAILYVTKRMEDQSQIEGYFLYKEQDQGLANGNVGEIYTIGGAWAGSCGEKWKVRAEGAHQFGHENGRTVRAYGFNSRGTYFMGGEWDHQLRLGYEFLSGDDASTPNVDEQWDPMWGRWPQWSELYIYSFAAETRIAEVTNIHRLGGGWTCHPTEEMEVCADYHLLWSHQTPLAAGPGFADHHFRGQLLTSVLRYKFNEHMSGHLLAEFFFPGPYYDDTRNDPAQFLRGEIVFTW